MVYEAGAAVASMSEEEQEKVREQLGRLLETHHFNHSRRYPPLLRFIVEETLAGRGEFLKERLLGIRVFGRPADYDTAADPIVRVTIAEIRKRIAQYYHDEEHDAEIRIELLPGRYAPEFRVRTTGRTEAATASAVAEMGEAGALEGAAPAVSGAGVPESSEEAATGRRLSPGWRVALASAVGLLLVLLGPATWRWVHPSAIDQLWAPITSSQRTILFCVPTDVGRKRGPVGGGEHLDPSSQTPLLKSSTPDGPTFLDYESLGENVVYSDMLATLRIANVLATRHQDYRSKPNVLTTLEDLREGPAVLIGGLDNQWTMLAVAPLRFHFAGSDEEMYWIADEKAPGFKGWSLDLKQHYRAVTRDYAIIARVHNEQTGQPEVIVAGIGMSGTAAAGEFIADAGHAEELRRRVGRGFKDHDFEAVLSTDVVNGIAGAPKIVAVSVW